MVIIRAVETSVGSFLEAAMVVFGYLLFFGHQVFEIEQAISIWALTSTSVLGIAMQGLALQWAFAKIDAFFQRFKDEQSPEAEEQLEFKVKQW
ncbi:hypothetical protein [Lentibacillus cibarius]|uniref:hypothetical protein n=1 Tax=Lentibacillus cibarius TaxID=2583219 RepID=UPI001F184CF5|nr:hypothetical protein [Lentibacillus cibarius]